MKPEEKHQQRLMYWSPNREAEFAVQFARALEELGIRIKPRNLLIVHTPEATLKIRDKSLKKTIMEITHECARDFIYNRYALSDTAKAEMLRWYTFEREQ